MYIVTVFDAKNEAIDERHFEFGTWKEIGFWLDHMHYNCPAYSVRVRFTI